LHILTNRPVYLTYLINKFIEALRFKFEFLSIELIQVLHQLFSEYKLEVEPQNSLEQEPHRRRCQGYDHTKIHIVPDEIFQASIMEATALLIHHIAESVPKIKLGLKVDTADELPPHQLQQSTLRRIHKDISEQGNQRILFVYELNLLLFVLVLELQNGLVQLVVNYVLGFEVKK
jgi:DNA-directed RNA polymerase subunit L